MNRWLPGSIPLFTGAFFKEPQDLPSGEMVSVKDTLNLPPDLSPGTYVLSIGMVEDPVGQTVVKLAIILADESDASCNGDPLGNGRHIH
ncbi:MAG: hypothetical protein ABSH20_09875 [Tepidisphaeraceae bacterium]